MQAGFLTLSPLGQCERTSARRGDRHLAPLAGRGRIASQDAIRVRGTLREFGSRGDSPSPQPSPRKRGEGVRRPLRDSSQRLLIDERAQPLAGGTSPRPGRATGSDVPDLHLKQQHAMTARSRGGSRPSFACVMALPKKREGAGNAGCWPHPWPACSKKTQSAVTTGSDETTGIPRATVLTFISCSPRCTGLFGHRPCATR